MIYILQNRHYQFCFISVFCFNNTFFTKSILLSLFNQYFIKKENLTYLYLFHALVDISIYRIII